jgi:hypothetical protein
MEAKPLPLAPQLSAFWHVSAVVKENDPPSNVW